MAVSIYTTPTCGYCIKVKQYLSEKGVKYSEYNVATDTQRVKRWSENQDKWVFRYLM